MYWIIPALGVPALFSVVNHLDKYLLRRYFSDTGARTMLLFSSLIGLVIAPVLFFLKPEFINLPLRDILILISSGALFILAMMPYFAALETEDASLVTSFFQFIPVFVFALGFFILGETVSRMQIIGSLIVIVGAFGMSLDLDNPTLKIKWRTLGLVTLSSLLFSLDTVFYKFSAVDTSLASSTGWQYVGFAVPGLVILLISAVSRRDFFQVLKSKSAPVLSLNILNELINFAAKVCLNLASLLAPISLVWVINGFQPFFVFFYGVLLTLFLPKIASENITKRVILQKLLFMTVMVAGAYMVER